MSGSDTPVGSDQGASAEASVRKVDGQGMGNEIGRGKVTTNDARGRLTKRGGKAGDGRGEDANGRGILGKFDGAGGI